MIELSAFAAALVVSCLLAMILGRVASIERQVAALWRVDAKLDLLLKSAGIEYDPHKNLPAQVIESLRRGEKIQAIKHYREFSGVGLREAKEFVEEVQRRAGLGG
jgi:ribosomal protein L7/L12